MNDVVRTTVEVERELWREMKAEAVLNDCTVSEQLESVLTERYQS